MLSRWKYIRPYYYVVSFLVLIAISLILLMADPGSPVFGLSLGWYRLLGIIVCALLLSESAWRSNSQRGKQVLFIIVCILTIEAIILYYYQLQ